jgi:hypothetical protein
MPIVDPFDHDDLDRVLTNKDRLIMVETILSWADLDTGLSRLILLIFGLDDDAGSILIGNMDLKTKAEKIKILYDHRQMKKDTESLTSLISGMKTFSACRNAIAHRKVIGRLKSVPTRIVFLSAKHIKRSPGQFEMLAIDHSEMIASAAFASNAAITVGKMITSLQSRTDNLKDS